MDVDPYAWLNSQQTLMSEQLQELANQNSGSGHLAGLMRVADWLEDWMDLPAAQFQRLPLPARRRIDDSGCELAEEVAPLLRWDLYPERKRRVLLAIHYDTVFSEDSPFQQCEWITNLRLQGPGVADAKGGIVVIRYALQALMMSGGLSNCGCSVLLNPDEEVGSPSSSQVFTAVAREFDFGLLFEPALPSGELVSERKGSGNFTLVMRGRSAHAGRDFSNGRNAVAELCRLLVEVDALNGQRAGMTVNVGAVRGGQAVNVVPDVAVARINVRVTEQASADWFVERLDGLVAAANAKEGYRCELHSSQSPPPAGESNHGRHQTPTSLSSPPKLIDDRQRQLMLAVEQASLAVGSPPVHWRATGGVCDGNKLAAAGLPNIDTLGPCGDGLHSAQEWVDIPSLVSKAQLVLNLLQRFDTGEFAELARQ